MPQLDVFMFQNIRYIFSQYLGFLNEFYIRIEIFLLCFYKNIIKKLELLQNKYYDSRLLNLLLYIIYFYIYT